MGVGAMNRMDFFKNLIEGYAIGEPILTTRLQSAVQKRFKLPPDRAAQATAIALKRLMDGGSVEGLRHYEKGIYFRTEMTPFGETRVDRNRVIALKYLEDDQGYEGGLSALNRIGLTTQMPNKRVIVTNKAKAGTRCDKSLDVTIRKPATRIMADNIRYLQLLDMLDCMERAPVDAERPLGILKSYAVKYGLRWERLLAYADRYYDERTLRRAVQLAVEGEPA